MLSEGIETNFPSINITTSKEVSGYCICDELCVHLLLILFVCYVASFNLICESHAISNTMSNGIL